MRPAGRHAGREPIGSTKDIRFMEILLAVHALATIMMAGLIWFVQLVHYPLFQLVGADDFARYEQGHTRRTTWIVAPLMILEMITAVSLVFLVHGIALRALTIVGVVLVVAIWTSTALVQVPCHRTLLTGFDLPAARRLVTTNWLRTVAWTVRAGLALVLPAMMQP
jgi:hypothetical protein